MPVRQGAKLLSLELSGFLGRYTQYQGHGAVIGLASRAEAPVNIVGSVRAIGWPVTDVGIAKTIATGSLTTAVVIGNDVVLAVMGIFAGANPGNRRHFRTRRTHFIGTTTATAKKPINGAVTPVRAAGWIVHIRIRGLRRLTMVAAGGCPGHGKQGYGRSTNQGGTYSTDKTPSRGILRNFSC